MVYSNGTYSYFSFRMRGTRCFELKLIESGTVVPLFEKWLRHEWPPCSEIRGCADAGRMDVRRSALSIMQSGAAAPAANTGGLPPARIALAAPQEEDNEPAPGGSARRLQGQIRA